MAEYLYTHWFALVLLLLGLILGSVALGWRTGKPGFLFYLLCGSTCALLGIGGIAEVLEPWGLGILLGSLGLLFLLLILVVVTGLWWAWLGYLLGAVLLFGLGAWGMQAAGDSLKEAGQFLATLEVAEPWWLLLLLLVPILILVSYRNLAGLGPVRRWVALGLRCGLVIFIVLALAETHARQTDRNVSVLFLWDRSLSIPSEYVGDSDQRQKRIFRFINESVALRKGGRDGDRAGVIVFGRWPRLELPPGKVDQLNFKKIHSPIDENYTDIASALKLALASFPEGAGKRIVLISDGNENLGNAAEQARIARQNGVQIDVLPIATSQRNPNEVLVERIEAPAFSEKDSRLPLRVVVRSFHPDVVVGDLHLIKTSLELHKAGGAENEQPVFLSQPVLVTRVKLRQGLNVFFFQQPGLKKDESFTFEAKFVPSHVESATGKKLQEKFPGDRVQNNRASTTVLARGQRAVLLLEPKVGDHELLANRLRQGGSLKVDAIDPKRLPQDTTQLAMILSKYDSIILANVPADEFTEAQQRVLRSNTHDQGAGLIMIGGPQSFGGGGWQGTEIEKALPVTCDLKSMKIEGKSGLVLIMHASEMAEGNAWQKKIAKLSLEKLSPMDMVGLLYWDWGGKGANGHTWHIPFQEIGGNRPKLLKLVDTMEPGDMPDVDPALEKALKELANPLYALGTKHIIFISDGDHWDASLSLLRKIGNAGITMTTVCITTHGKAEIDKMAAVAYAVKTPQGTRGRSYHIKDPSELPAIYIKETRLVSQSFVHEKQFQPNLVFSGGPTEGIRQLDPLFGFVRTMRRPSPLVEMPIKTPKIGEADFPLLAYWTYGLGKAVAFTSDARTNPGKPAFWDRDWANSPIYNQFWKQTVEWSLRALESGQFLYMTTEHRDGKVRVIVEAQDKDKRPLTNVDLQAGLTSPSFNEKELRKIEVKFEQKSAGVYEAEFQAEEVGSYFLHVKGTWWDRDNQKVEESVRTGITIPYSPEFAEMESNTGLLLRLADMTGGKVYEESNEVPFPAAASGEIFRPVPTSQRSLQTLWFFLVVITGVGLFFDVAVRRISLEPAQVQTKLQNLWAYLRGRQATLEPAGQFLERLKSRKAQVGETIEKEKGTRRFEAAEGQPAPAAPEIAATGPASALPKPKAPPSVTPDKEKEASDFASRLMKAKKRAMQDRDKDKG
jgi:uncharacterized membrane protein